MRESRRLAGCCCLSSARLRATRSSRPRNQLTCARCWPSLHYMPKELGCLCERPHLSCSDLADDLRRESGLCRRGDTFGRGADRVRLVEPLLDVVARSV
jgi:hypothetical protein